MAAPLNPAHLDDAITRYLAGEAQAQLLATTGVSASTLHRERNRRGIPPRRNLTLPVDEIVAAYQGGESELSLSDRYGISRTAIRQRLTEAGVKMRGRSEAGRTRAAQMTPAERARQSTAAHDAARGRVRPYEEACRMALGREASGAFGSDGEQTLADWLTETGMIPVPQKAVGKYNVDIAMTPVAVEVLGGGWHAEKRHARRHNDILDAGWHLVYVWNHEGRSALARGAADYVVAFLEEVRRNPPTVGQYRVIGGSGELLAAGCRDDHEFALVPPPRGR